MKTAYLIVSLLLIPAQGRATDIIGNAATTTALQSSRTINGVGFDGTGNIIVTAAPSPSFNNTPGRSLVTAINSANGFQVDAARCAMVSYSYTISSAVQIGVATNVEGYIVLEICATNSSTGADWAEISRVANAQNISLAIALASTSKNGQPLVGMVPGGYYSRLRSVNVAGTPTYTANGQQEVKL